jgi:hypothetical protein
MKNEGHTKVERTSGLAISPCLAGGKEALDDKADDTADDKARATISCRRSSIAIEVAGEGMVGRVGG